MNFILSLLLIYAFFQLIIWLAARWWKYKLRKAARKNGTYDESSPEPRKKKKVFRKDDGDYVDFEEIGKPEK